jgi:hypothetical protein
MTAVSKIKSKSTLGKNTKFKLSLFKKPFASKEKKKFKRYETINFKSNYFLNASKEFNKIGKILIISGPARNGNHILKSMLDGHPEINQSPGEDFLLREFLSKCKENEKKLINKIKNLTNINFITNMSGAYMNKWKKLHHLKKKKKVLKVYAGTQPVNKSHVIDYQDYVPSIFYERYSNYLKKNLINIKRSKSFLDFFKIYLESLAELVKKKNNLKYKHLYTYSGMRRELFYLFERTNNIVCLCPIREFDTYYYSYVKARYKTNQIKQKPLDDLWEHWRHKTIDYLMIKKKYPNKIMFVKFEDLINNPKGTGKRICKKLGIKYSNKLKTATILGKSVKGNSSIPKSDNYKGAFYKDPLSRKLPKKLLPNEYFDILKLVHKQCI